MTIAENPDWQPLEPLVPWRAVELGGALELPDGRVVMPYASRILREPETGQVTAAEIQLAPLGEWISGWAAKPASATDVRFHPPVPTEWPAERPLFDLTDAISVIAVLTQIPPTTADINPDYRPFEEKTWTAPVGRIRTVEGELVDAVIELDGEGGLVVGILGAMPLFDREVKDAV